MANLPPGFTQTNSDGFAYADQLTNHGWTWQQSSALGEMYGYNGYASRLGGTQGETYAYTRDLANTDVADCISQIEFNAVNGTLPNVCVACLELRADHDHTKYPVDNCLRGQFAQQYGSGNVPSIKIYKRVAAVWTQLATLDVSAFAANDVLTFSAVGNNKTAYRNGSSVLSENADSSITTGRAILMNNSATTGVEVRLQAWKYGVPEAPSAPRQIMSPQLRRDHPRFREV